MTVAQSRVLRVAAWVAAVVGAVLLVLTFVPVPCGSDRSNLRQVLLQAGALVAFGLMYACVEGKRRSRRIVAIVPLALLPLALCWSRVVVVVGLRLLTALGERYGHSPQPGSTGRPLSDVPDHSGHRWWIEANRCRRTGDEFDVLARRHTELDNRPVTDRLAVGCPTNRRRLTGRSRPAGGRWWPAGQSTEFFW